MNFLHATSDMEKNNLTNLGIRKPINNWARYQNL